MRILVDADACPVTRIAERVAKEEGLPLLLFCDTSHILNSDYGEIVVVSQGADAVDLALMNRAKGRDIVITQDYGVAAMTLGKGAFPLHQSGRRYTDENIESMLLERHLSAKARRSSAKNHGKGPRKRTSQDDLDFEAALRALILEKREED